MLLRFNKRSRAQSTAEYAILLGLVIAAAAAMQIYMKRGLQARTHIMSRVMVDQTNALDVGAGQPVQYQYEPYYLNSEMTVARDSNADSVLEREGNFLSSENATTTRETGGYQSYGYEAGKDDNR